MNLDALLLKQISSVDADAWIVTAILLVCLGGLVGVFVWSIGNWIRTKRQSRLLDAQPIQPDPTVTVHARILEKKTDIVYGKSMRYPTHEVCFLVTFATDDNQIIKYHVPQEVFALLKEFSEGTLVTAGDRFVDFAEDPTAPSESTDKNHLILESHWRH